MTDHQAPVGAHQPELGIEVVEGDRGDDHRHDDRRQDEAEGRVLEGKAAAGEGDRAEGAEDHGQHHAHRRHPQAEPQGVGPVVGLDELPVPLEGKAARREPEVEGIGDGDGKDQHDRRQQKDGDRGGDHGDARQAAPGPAPASADQSGDAGQGQAQQVGDQDEPSLRPLQREVAERRPRSAEGCRPASPPGTGGPFGPHLVAAPDAVQPHDPVEGQEQRQGHHQQDQGQGAGEAPLEEFLDLGGDEHGQHGVPQAPEQGRRDVEADGEDEHQQRTRPHPRQTQGEVDPEEGLHPPRAQAVGDLDQARVDAPHDAVEGQHHDRQHDVGHADDDAGGVVDQPDGLIDQAEGEQGLVDDAVATQDHQPGIAAHQDAGEVRQHHRDDQQVAPPLRNARQHVGQGVAEDQAQQGRLDADLQGRQQHRHVDRRGERGLVVLQGELGIEDAEAEQPGDRVAEEEGQERHRREQQQPGPVGRAANGRGGGSAHARTGAGGPTAAPAPSPPTRPAAAPGEGVALRPRPVPAPLEGDGRGGRAFTSGAHRQTVSP